jgi:hypothetical protein
LPLFLYRNPGTNANNIVIIMMIAIKTYIILTVVLEGFI